MFGDIIPGNIIHHQLGETIGIVGSFESDFLWTGRISVGSSGRGVDYICLMRECQIKQVFEGIDIGFDHQILLRDGRIRDSRFVKDVIKGVVKLQFFQSIRIIEITAYDFP